MVSIGVGRNPTGADQAWWCPAKVRRRDRPSCHANGPDVAAAAAQLHTPLNGSRDCRRARYQSRRSNLDCTLNAARLRGDLFFNSALSKKDLRFQITL